MIRMIRKEYRETPAEYRSTIDGQPIVLTLDKPTGATVLAPVEIIEEPLSAYEAITRQKG